MRFLIPIFAVLFIWACNGGGPSETSTTATTASASLENRKLENPNITVNVNGLPAGGEAILIGFFADQRFKADSTMVGANGQMLFQRAEPYNPGFYFLLMPNNSAVQMLIDADQSFTMTTQLNDLVGSMAVDGSLDNELLYSNLKFEAQLQPQFQQIGQQLQS
ncbi:MAG: DUF4369 domain-containing protein, partial [Bacteroidota bacterium]